MLSTCLQDRNLWGGLCHPCPICAVLLHPYPWGWNWGREHGLVCMRVRARLDVALLHAGHILLPSYPIPYLTSHPTTQPWGSPGAQGF